MQPSILITMGLLAIGAISAPTSYSSGPVLKAENAINDVPYVAKMQATIEGVSVDKEGNFYAVDQTSFNNLNTGKVIFSRPGATTKEVFLAGSRSTCTHGYLIADAASHAVYSVGGTATNTTSIPQNGVFGPTGWLQPNDLALSTDESTIYFSGQDYTAGTGDLHYVRPAPGAPLSQYRYEPVKIDLPAGIGRTNGIEVSNDNNYLFITSSVNKKVGEQITVDSASVWRFDIDAASGAPLPATAKKVMVYYDKAAYPPSELVAGIAEAGMDPDGMRLDTAGYMYSTLNAAGKVMRWNTAKPDEYQVIDLPTISHPTNLELGGKDGKTLVVVGKCKKDAPVQPGQVVCADKVVNCPAAGRAWTSLQKGKLPPAPKQSAPPAPEQPAPPAPEQPAPPAPEQPAPPAPEQPAPPAPEQPAPPAPEQPAPPAPEQPAPPAPEQATPPAPQQSAPPAPQDPTPPTPQKPSPIGHNRGLYTPDSNGY